MRGCKYISFNIILLGRIIQTAAFLFNFHRDTVSETAHVSSQQYTILSGTSNNSFHKANCPSAPPSLCSMRFACLSSFQSSKCTLHICWNLSGHFSSGLSFHCASALHAYSATAFVFCFRDRIAPPFCLSTLLCSSLRVVGGGQEEDCTRFFQAKTDILI